MFFLYSKQLELYHNSSAPIFIFPVSNCFSWYPLPLYYPSLPCFDVWGFSTPNGIPSYCDPFTLCSRASNIIPEGPSSFPHYLCEKLVWSVFGACRLFWCRCRRPDSVVTTLLTIFFSNTTLICSGKFYFPPLIVGKCLCQRQHHLLDFWERWKS